ncbi:class I SAM-dependent methyltransferase [Haloimpatiens sp. FM7315]|uniref:class I SAM-dependent methyltransferase n=1 Tax=Haloimpatiens sp. FM7315 TaxID=3298609 RepID=UPI003977DD40
MMGYTVETLEKSRAKGFRPKKIFGLLLREFLGLKDNFKILDLGCGTGFFTRIIAKETNAEITGIDINQELLKGANKISKENSLNIKYEIGDITNIQYKDNTFDIVICDIMLECFNDISIPLREMKRVCKTGGKVVCIEPFYQSSIEYYEYTDKSTRNLILKLARDGRDFGLGPMLPHFLNEVGLKSIDMISWFWGGIEYKTLDLISIDDKLNDMRLNFNRIKKQISQVKDLSEEEGNKVITFFQTRLNYFEKNPKKLYEDMSVMGLPVFIVKGLK